MPRQYAFRLVFTTPPSIFTGLGVAGLVDRIIVRDAKRLPVIPGSTVKGRWRFFAERLLRGAGLAAPFSLHDDHAPACRDIATACTLCRLFGSPSIPAGIQVGQAQLEDPEPFERLLADGRNPVVSPDADIRPFVALSRRLRTARPYHLGFDETIPPVAFSGSVRLTTAPTDAELRFLKAAGALVDALGARKAAGRGRLEGGIQLDLGLTE